MKHKKGKPGNFFIDEKVIAACTDPVLLLHPGGLIGNANQAMLDFLQFDPAGRNIRELVPEIVRESTKQAAVHKEDNFNEKFVYRFRDSTGKVKYFTCSQTSIHQKENIETCLLVWHDITAIIEKEQQLEKSNRELTALVNDLRGKQKRAEKWIVDSKEELREKKFQIIVSNKLLEIIFSNTHFLIAYLTPDFHFIQVNDAYARAFKKKAAFFVNKNYFDLLGHTENRSIFEDVVKTGKSYIAYADQFFPHNQSGPVITYWDWSIQAIKTAIGVEGLIIVQIDVTRRKNAEDDLLNAKRLSDIGMLAATVAHSLRNPLGVIQAAAYSIKKKCQTADVDKHIENIEAVIEESEQIINNLLSYAHLKIPRRIKVFVHSFLDEFFNDIRSKNANPEINLTAKYEDLQEVVAYIDPFQIREILNNIIDNAYQELALTGGCIKIKCCLSDSSNMEFSITDNGGGIKEEHLSKIFDPFFTSKSKGTGLGLTISKELIKLHNGNIEVLSRGGEGTSVKIFLPLNGQK